jgi:hypothetical protein
VAQEAPTLNPSTAKKKKKLKIYKNYKIKRDLKIE